MAIGWGVIGCGRIANGRAIPEGIMVAENAWLVGVCDLLGDRAQATANQFGGQVYQDTAALLSDPAIDAVYIAAPPATHADLTINAAQER